MLKRIWYLLLDMLGIEHSNHLKPLDPEMEAFKTFNKPDKPKLKEKEIE